MLVKSPTLMEERETRATFIFLECVSTDYFPTCSINSHERKKNGKK